MYDKIYIFKIFFSLKTYIIKIYKKYEKYVNTLAAQDRNFVFPLEQLPWCPMDFNGVMGLMLKKIHVSFLCDM